VTNPHASTGTAGDGWGPATSVRVGEGRRTSSRDDTDQREPGGARSARPAQHGESRDDASWSPAGPLAARDRRATRRADRDQAAQYGAAYETPLPRAPERGLPWWAAMLVLLVIAVIGVVIDGIGSSQARGGFNIGIVVASVIAIFAVKRSHMFPIVIAPPIVYSIVAMGQLYSTSSGLHDKKAVFDAAANYLVYGFPAIAAATAAVLIIAGIRLIARK
jgi:hypothetical protein